MNVLDIIIGIVLIVFAIKGLVKGVINEVVSLIAIVAGLYGAFYCSDITANYLKGIIDIKPEYLSTIALLITFALLVVIIVLIGKLLAKILESLSLGWIDKLGGFLFGILKGSLIVSLLILLLNVLNISSFIPQDKRESSMLYGPVEKVAPYIYQNYDIVREAIDNSKGLFEKGKETIGQEQHTATPC